jgi:FkbM family methyltransferase
MYATEADVVACYRLFLGREPDVEGFKNFRAMVASGRHPLDDLVALFLRSPEHQRREAARRQRGERLETVALERFRMLVAPDWNAVNREIASTRTYEPHVTRQVAARLRPGMTFVDLGANCGYFSLLAASLGARVHAFEPGARNLWLLRRNAALNGFSIDIHPHAVGGREELVAYDPIEGNGMISALGDSLPAEGQQVLRMVTLDGTLGGQSVDAIKMDVEGAEGLVLDGAEAVLARRPTLFAELAPASLCAVSGTTAVAFLDRLARLGYRLAAIPRDGAEPVFDSPAALLARLERSGAGFADLLAAA